jgi:benzil reductase ((S)-benzoin forming)
VTDRIALVTGSSSGMGAALVRELLDRRWTVIGLARRPAQIRHQEYEHLQLDLADLGGVVRRVNADLAPRLAEPRWRRVGLVNNAASPAGLGPLPSLGILELEQVHAVNTVAPVWLMGFVTKVVRAESILRIANVSSGAATTAFPGLAAYASSKAALRMAGMVLAAEWESGAPGQPLPTDAAILSYEPGVVDTEMQATARSQSPEEFPWVGMFRDFAARGVLQPPAGPAGDLARFLESDRQPRFAERRFQG